MKQITFDWAKEKDLKELIPLWESNFGDERAYIEAFLSAYQNTAKIPVLKADSQIVCGCYLLPAFYCTQNGEKRVWYLYALSTKAEEQGKGYATLLLQGILKNAAERGEGVLLVPESGLETFYEKRGFSMWIREANQAVFAKNNGGNTIMQIKEIKIDEQLVGEYEKQRNCSLKEDGYIRWSRQAIAYALSEHLSCGGKLLHIMDGEEGAFVLAYFDEQEKTVYIKEITARQTLWEEYAELTAGYWKAERAVIKGKTVMITSDIMTSDMGAERKQGYFNLTLG